MFDVNSFDLLDTVELDLKGPNGKPIGWQWTVAGPGHPQTRALSDRLLAESLARARDIDRARIAHEVFEPPLVTPEEARRRVADAMAGRVVTWSPAAAGAEPLPFSREAAAALLGDPRKDWLFGQLEGLLKATDSFRPRSA